MAFYRCADKTLELKTVASFAEFFVWACSVQAMTFRNLENAVRKGRALEFLDAVPEAWRRGVGGGVAPPPMVLQPPGSPSRVLGWD